MKPRKRTRSGAKREKEEPEAQGVFRVIQKGNRDVLGQVEKQSAMDALLAFLEVTAGAEVKRGLHSWLVAMPDTAGDLHPLTDTVLSEGNLVGRAEDPEHAQALGRELASRYTPDMGVPGYAVLDMYAEKFYMKMDAWGLHDSESVSTE